MLFHVYTSIGSAIEWSHLKALHKLILLLGTSHLKRQSIPMVTLSGHELMPQHQYDQDDF